MKIKIISDGTVRGTNVVNAETGESLDNVIRIEWSIIAGRDMPLARATIEIVSVQLELVGEAAVSVMPAYALVAGLEDGSAYALLPGLDGQKK